MRRSISLLVAFCLFINACATNKKNLDSKKGSGPAEDLPPMLLSPSVKKIWIAPIIKNGGLEWEAGHYLYRIERETTWSR